MLSRSVETGFTLVELVATIIVIGILAITVLPNFVGRSGFAEHALRSQILAALRFTQQRAMYEQQAQAGICYRLQIDKDGSGTDGFVTQRYNTQGTVAPGDDSVENIGLSASTLVDIFNHKDYQAIAVTAPAAIYFDGMGNALGDTGGSCSGTPTSSTIVLSDSETLQIAISSTGYVRPI